MGAGDKISNKIDYLSGKAKEAVGNAAHVVSGRIIAVAPVSVAKPRLTKLLGLQTCQHIE